MWPRPHLAGRQVVLLIKARGLPAAEVPHKPPHQVVSESGAVDPLDEEAMRISDEHLQDVHRYGSARGFVLVEARDTLAEIESRVETVECLSLKPCWEGCVPSAFHNGGENEPLQYLHCRGRAVRWGGRSDPGLEASLPSKSGIWRSSSKLPGYQFQQLKGWRAQSGRSGRAYLGSGGEARWARQAPGRRKSPPFLMAAATPLTSNGLYEGSTRWWRRRSLISLLTARSC